MECRTRQFVERRGDDFVFLVTDEKTGKTGELILSSNLGTKVRPFPPATFAPESFFLRFPLEVGSRWSGTFDQSGVLRTRSARVTGYSDLVLKAGTFKAFRIDAENKRQDRSTPAFERYYYCPELAIVCKYESRDFNQRWEVVEVKKVQR